MQHLTVHLAFVAILVGTQAFFTALSVLNVRHADRLVDRKTAWLDDVLGVDDPTELSDYHRLTTAFSELQSWVGLGVLLVVLYAGGLEWAVGLLASTGLSTVSQGILFFAGLVVAAQLFSLLFSIVSTFGIEEIFDFNQQTPSLFVRDTLLTLVISLGFTAVLGGAVLAAVNALPTLWPVAAWLLFVAFSLVMQILYPRVIAPLFNEFEPVDSGELREVVEDVFERAGFSTSDIYTMDASRRSSQLNAYFIGFGRTKRVVLFDTLVDSMAIPELQGVLAHELAHWKEAHIWKQFASSAVRMGIVFGLLGVLVDFGPLYTAFGIPETATYAGLLLAVLIVGPILQFTAPLTNKLSLKHEREADSFAADVMGPQPMVDALARLATENLANPFPHPWYATFHHSHPPIPERIRLLQERSDADEPATDLDGATPADD
ncbi:STE24 endopeptidase [Halohasta litchfieldiae]|jgi:STE24 endopeptidase|uniref:STE24 endopeptidase n=1 Tax=Halohasta litchfieldiae TaxID=1073996 RepID=A0A1H6SYY6_9EURY|nr:M48 family metallopeptidase [Halohasta litchfieldiae]ATW86949.1 STE24 endopeptidase [Halohasta litchfieldiae]SEI71054.1 STE24 endopeptidase [Halohasta litchfieldiae]